MLEALIVEADAKRRRVSLQPAEPVPEPPVVGDYMAPDVAAEASLTRRMPHDIKQKTITRAHSRMLSYLTA